MEDETGEQHILKGILPLTIAVGGNMVLAGLFLRALINPLQHTDFIFRTGPWLFMAELISIFAIGFSLRRLGKINAFFAILEGGMGILFIAVFALGFGFFILQDLTIPLVFLGSIIAKAFGSKAAAEDLQVRKPAFGVLLLLSLLFVFAVLTPLLVKTFPFPEEVFLYKTTWEEWEKKGYTIHYSGGEFTDRPQTLLGWGAIYYSLAAAMEAGLFLRSRKYRTASGAASTTLT